MAEGRSALRPLVGLAAVVAAGWAIAVAQQALDGRRQVLVSVSVVAGGGLIVYMLGRLNDRRPQSRGNGNDELKSSADEKKEAVLEVFNSAREFAANGGLGNIENDTQLKLYAMFKQATIGDCTAPRPSVLDLIGSAKWKAWQSMRGVNPVDAAAYYVALVSELSPGWLPMEENEVAQKSKEVDEAQKGQTRGGSMGPSVSTMQMEEEKAESDQTISEKLFAMAGKGDVDALLKGLEGMNLEELKNLKGEDQISLLHMACDRGDIGMANRLIELGIPVDIRDVDGLTPLAYALMNERDELSSILVSRYKADLEAKDNDGNGILSLCSSEKVKQSLKSHDHAF